jgi:hypothetical protein
VRYISLCELRVSTEGGLSVAALEGNAYVSLPLVSYMNLLNFDGRGGGKRERKTKKKDHEIIIFTEKDLTPMILKRVFGF